MRPLLRRAACRAAARPRHVHDTSPVGTRWGGSGPPASPALSIARRAPSSATPFGASVAQQKRQLSLHQTRLCSGHSLGGSDENKKEKEKETGSHTVLRPLARRVRRRRLLGRAGLRHGGRSRVRVRPADRQARTALCTTLRHHWCDRRRGRLMAESPSRGAMMSVRASPEAARRAVHEAGVAGRAAVACLNGPASVGCCGEYAAGYTLFCSCGPPLPAVRS